MIDRSKSYKAGTIFRFIGPDEYFEGCYMLSRVSPNKLHMINIENGNRWSKPMESGHHNFSIQQIEDYMEDGLKVTWAGNINEYVGVHKL